VNLCVRIVAYKKKWRMYPQAPSSFIIFLPNILDMIAYNSAKSISSNSSIIEIEVGFTRVCSQHLEPCPLKNQDNDLSHFFLVFNNQNRATTGESFRASKSKTDLWLSSPQRQAKHKLRPPHWRRLNSDKSLKFGARFPCLWSILNHCLDQLA